MSERAAQTDSRKRRIRGDESRVRILDATLAIASERGYEGTSISLVSARSGLPASSIYWHFRDKDGLIAAVIERSFRIWFDATRDSGAQANAPLAEQVAGMVGRTARGLETAPDFLRLGLMLLLERRPEEPTARAMFLQVREEALSRVTTAYRRLLPALDAAGAEKLAVFSMALADGLFIDRESRGSRVDLMGDFGLQAAAILGVAEHLLEGQVSDPPESLAGQTV